MVNAARTPAFSATVMSEATFLFRLSYILTSIVPRYANDRKVGSSHYRRH
jgi:hypothetical protein